jgi:hypothetical protein
MNLRVRLRNLLQTPSMPIIPVEEIHNHPVLEQACDSTCPNILVVPTVAEVLMQWAIPLDLIVPHFDDEVACIEFAARTRPGSTRLDLYSDGRLLFKSFTDDQGRARRGGLLVDASYMFVVEYLYGGSHVIGKALRQIHLWPEYSIDGVCYEIERFGRVRSQGGIMVPDTNGWGTYPQPELMST